MKLTYIYHSGFAIQRNDLTIIIDYFKDSSEEIGNRVVQDELLKKPGKLYVLSSHSHPDHFNNDILKWKEQRDDIIYLFSKDILDNKKAESDDAIYLDKLDTYKDENLTIQAFGSTDLGISFLIYLGEKMLFHAGDLNNWHWNEESTKEEIEEAETAYEKELNLLAEHVKHLDLAIFPIDSRLGKDYMKGGEQFLNAIETDFFAPMHFKDYESAAAFANIAIRSGCNSISWRYRGESMSF